MSDHTPKRVATQPQGEPEGEPTQAQGESEGEPTQPLPGHTEVW